MSLRDNLLHNIRAYMAKRGVTTMSELARISKVPQPTLHRFTSGDHDSISLQHIDRIARALEVDVAQLCAPPFKSLPPYQSEAFIGVMEQLTPNEQGVVLATSAALIESRKETG